MGEEGDERSNPQKMKCHVTQHRYFLLDATYLHVGNRDKSNLVI